MTNRSLVTRMRNGRHKLDAVLAAVPHEDMTKPGVAGEWSVKDIVAHIHWHEREIVGMLRTHAFTGSPLWNLPLDERNAAIYEENRDRTLEAVLSDHRFAFAELLIAFISITDEDLVDPARFPGMPPEWQPWQIIAQNTYEHYNHHAADVRSWLGRT